MENIKNKFTLPNLPVTDQFVIWVRYKKSFPRDLNAVKNLVDSLATNLGLKIVKHSSHLFNPGGITYVAILSQSHLVIHTWPEQNVMRVDLVTCQILDRSLVKIVVYKLFPEQELTWNGIVQA